MRAFFAFIATALLAAFVAVLVLFALANQSSATYELLGGTFAVALWVPAVVAAALGVVLTLLAVEPALSASSRDRRIERDRAMQLDRQLAEQHTASSTLRSRVATLEGERDTALQARDEAARERDDAQTRAEHAEAAAMSAIRHAPPPEMTASDLASTGQPLHTPRMDAAVPAATMREATESRASDRASGGDGAVEERPFEVVRAEKPTIGERLRSMFGPTEPVVEDPHATPDGTTPIV